MSSTTLDDSYTLLFEGNLSVKNQSSTLWLILTEILLWEPQPSEAGTGSLHNLCVFWKFGLWSSILP